MRTTVKFRVFYLSVMAIVYGMGFWLLPDRLDTPTSTILTTTFIAAYFAFLPSLYWYCVILKGKEKKWKLLIPFSLGCVVARYSLPQELANYFEVASYLRYPIIVIFLLIELALIWHILSMVWKVRKIQGDPRINALLNIPIKEDKQRALSLMMAYEPACWYYSIPYFSRNHAPKITNLATLSQYKTFSVMLLLLITLVSGVTYILVTPLSHIAAIVVSSLIGYCSFWVVANYRIAKDYSVYLHRGHLIVNATFLNMLIVPLADIEELELGSWQSKKECLKIGRAKVANIKLNVKENAQWLMLSGTFQEQPNEIYLAVEDPQKLKATIHNEVHVNIEVTKNVA